MKKFLSIKISNFYNALKNISEKNTSEPKIILPMKRSIQLDNYSCAVHASNSILKIFDKHLELDIISSKLGTTKEDGTDTGPILQLFENLNVSYEINENAGIGDIVNNIRKGYPMLITVDNWEHWCVIYGYSFDFIFILDSNWKSFRCRWRKEEFLKRWDDNWIAVFKK